MENEKKSIFRDEYNNFRYWLLGVIVVIGLILFFILNPFAIVGSGERGVVTNWGAVQEEIRGEGLSFRTPIMQAVNIVDVKTQKVEVEAGAGSKDMQTVNTKVALNFHPDAGKVNKLYQETQSNYNDVLINPAIQEAVKATTAQFTAEELITKREEVKVKMRANITERLAPKYIIVEDLNITDLDFSKSFNEAIEAKVTAEQNRLKAETELKITEINKQKQITEAQGKAEAIRIEGEALKSSAQVAQLRWIEKWDGKMPTYYGSATPFVGINQ